MRIPSLILAVSLFFSLTVHSQDTLLTTRWSLSFNPLGLIEAPCALGVGVGYRVSSRLELWSETSFLTNGFYKTQGPLTGVREVLEGKYFVDDERNFFIGAEIRYKSYQYRDTEDFYNPATHDTLSAFSNFSRHYFWGVGAQLGWRAPLTPNGRLQIELSAGIGVRKFTDIRHDIPSGFEFTYHGGTDIKVTNIEYQIKDVYFPGSIRLIYLFGKRLRP